MKFVTGLILLITLLTSECNAQRSGTGCEYRGSPRRPILPYRVYQEVAAESYLFHPTYNYSNNSVLPINDGCYKWDLTGSYGSCYVYDGFSYYEGYAGVMRNLDCPLDDYLPFLIIGSAFVAFFLLRKKNQYGTT